MKSIINVRPYIKSDAQALADIYYNTIHTINKLDYTEEQLNAWAPSSSLETTGWLKKWEKLPPLVAEFDGNIVGFTEFVSSGYIDCFYVHHNYQHMGIGRALMLAIFNKALEKKIKLIYAEVSITAKPFF